MTAPSIYCHEPAPTVVTLLPRGQEKKDEIHVDYYGEWAWFRYDAFTVSPYTPSDRRWAELRFGPEWAEKLSEAARRAA